MDMNILLAQLQEQTELGSLWHHILLAIVFSFLGIVILAFSLFLMERLTPFSLLKELAEEHNVAIAVVVASVVLGMSLIIGAAILG